MDSSSIASASRLSREGGGECLPSGCVFSTLFLVVIRAFGREISVDGREKESTRWYFSSFLSAPLSSSVDRYSLDGQVDNSIDLRRNLLLFGCRSTKGTAEVDSLNWMSYREMIFFCLMRPCSYGVDCRRAVFVAMALFVSFSPKLLIFIRRQKFRLLPSSQDTQVFAFFFFIFISFLSGELKVSFFFFVQLWFGNLCHLERFVSWPCPSRDRRLDVSSLNPFGRKRERWTEMFSLCFCGWELVGWSGNLVGWIAAATTSYN